MRRPTSSAFQWFSRLSYSQKFTVITLVFMIPVIAFIPLISDQLTNINRYGVSELSGTIYLRSVWNFSEQVRDYVNATNQYAEGDIPLAELREVEARTDARLDDLKKVNDQYGSSLDTANVFPVIQQQWLRVKETVRRTDWSAFETGQSALLESIAILTSQVGDLSYLILDPDLDTYYMMDTVLIKAPENQALLFEAYQVTAQSLKNGSFSVEDRTRLIAVMGRLQANLNTMNRNIGVAIQNDQQGSIQQVISVPLASYDLQLRSFIDLINETLNTPTPNNSGRLQELGANYDAVVHAADSDLYSAASLSLERGIQNRITSLRQRLAWIAVIVSASILSAFLIGRLMMRSISQPLTELMDATKRLSAGNMSSRVTVNDLDEMGQVGIAFNQMAEELERDKQSLIARTAELDTARSQSENRAHHLQRINEISRIISSEHTLDVLLPLIARVVSEKLGFYHIGFFLLDDSRTFAILKATNNAGKQNVQAQDIRLKVGNPGLVATAIATGKPQVASRAETDQASQHDSFLPNTRSELALPIRLGGELIGVLDIQSLHENAFAADEIEILEVLAGQLGIAIQNARLYEQNVQSLKDTEEAYRRLSGSSWSSMVQQVDIRAYTYDGVSSHPVSEVQSTAKPAALSVPITVRGQVIGKLRLNPLDPNRTWTEDDIAITNAIAERAALALEAARLLEEAQRRASRETFLSDMASKLSTSFQLDSILRDTVEELGQTLKNSTVSFQLVNPSAPPNGNGTRPDDSFVQRKKSE